jgi:hypothetical protein
MRARQQQPATLRVKGFTALQRDLAKTEKRIRDDIHQQIRQAAEPIRRDAETFARHRISHIGRQWFRMRIGLTPHGIYVAPRMRATRNRSRKRPNLARLLERRAMTPARRKNTQLVKRRVQKVINRNVQRFNHGG